MKSHNRILGLTVKITTSYGLSRGLNPAVYLNGAESFTSGQVSNQNHLSTKILSTWSSSDADLDSSFAARSLHLT